MNAVEIDARNAQIATAMCTHRDENCGEPLTAEVGNHEIPARRVVELKGDVASLEYLAHLGFDHAPGQSILWNPEI